MTTRTPLYNQLRTQIRSLTGFDFQRFVVELCLALYGTDGFTPLRERKDDGADGLINSERTVVACYGPFKYDERMALSKVKGDYDSYKNNWRGRFQNWRLYYNQEPSPALLKLVDDLHHRKALWGLDEIIADLENLPHSKRRPIYHLLSIDGDLIGQDFLRILFDDMLTEKAKGNLAEYKKKAPDIEKKIRINFKASETEEVEAVSAALISQKADVDEVLSAYDETDINQLKATVCQQFYETRPNEFGAKFHQLIAVYRAKYNAEGDDGMKNYISAAVVLLFEQCVFGKDPETS